MIQEAKRVDPTGATANDAAGTITGPARIWAEYEARDVSLGKRFEELLRCWASVGGTVTVYAPTP